MIQMKMWTAMLKPIRNRDKIGTDAKKSATRFSVLAGALLPDRSILLAASLMKSSERLSLL